MEVKPKIQGYKQWGDSDLDGGFYWAVYDPKITDEEIARQHSAFYSGVGRPFSGPPAIRRTKTRVLVTQRVGWDI